MTDLPFTKTTSPVIDVVQESYSPKPKSYTLKSTRTGIGIEFEKPDPAKRTPMQHMHDMLESVKAVQQRGTY